MLRSCLSMRVQLWPENAVYTGWKTFFRSRYSQAQSPGTLQYVVHFPNRSRKDYLRHEGFFRIFPISLVLISFPTSQLHAQDWVHTAPILAPTAFALRQPTSSPRSADADFKGSLRRHAFNDLGNAGIFDLVSKSMAPGPAGSPQEMNLSQWAADPQGAWWLSVRSPSPTAR